MAALAAKDARLVAEAEPAVLDHRRPRMDVQVGRHPVAVVIAERPEGVEVLATDHLDQPAVGLVEVGHGEADVVEPAQSGQSHRGLLAKWIQR